MMGAESTCLDGGQNIQCRTLVALVRSVDGNSSEAETRRGSEMMPMKLALALFFAFGCLIWRLRRSFLDLTHQTFGPLNNDEK